MAIVVKQNQIQTISAGGSQENCNIIAQNILQTIVNLFASFEGVWTLVEDVNSWIIGNSSYPTIYTLMLQNENTNEYMRLWYGVTYINDPQYSCFYLTDTDKSSTYNHIYIHKNNLFRLYMPSKSVKYYAYPICNIMCGISDATISKELGNDLGLKLPIFELFDNLLSNGSWYYDCSLQSEGGSSQTRLACSSYYDQVSNCRLKFSVIADDDDSKFVFVVNHNGGYSGILRWSSYNKELVIPANENDEYLQGVVYRSGTGRAVFRAVDGSIQFGQYDTVLDGVALPAGAASDEGIVASPLFLSSQLESAGLDVPNVDNGSGYKGQIKTDWLLVSNSQVAGTTHNQGTWLNVGSGILVPWSPDAGSPFIS